LITKGAFQELDAVSLLTPHTKLAIRPPTVESVPGIIAGAYRTSWYGRPGTGFVDLPADIIQGEVQDMGDVSKARLVPQPVKPGGDPEKIAAIAVLLRTAKAPLIVIGKGAAYAQAEGILRILVDK
jgi:2-hydroxyacyl-CoA lyase 1